MFDNRLLDTAKRFYRLGMYESFIETVAAASTNRRVQLSPITDSLNSQFAQVRKNLLSVTGNKLNKIHTPKDFFDKFYTQANIKKIPPSHYFDLRCLYDSYKHAGGFGGKKHRYEITVGSNTRIAATAKDAAALLVNLWPAVALTELSGEHAEQNQLLQEKALNYYQQGNYGEMADMLYLLDPNYKMLALGPEIEKALTALKDYIQARELDHPLTQIVSADEFIALKRTFIQPPFGRRGVEGN